MTAKVGRLGDGQQITPQVLCEDGTAHPCNQGLCSVTTRYCIGIFSGKGFGAHVGGLSWCRGN